MINDEDEDALEGRQDEHDGEEEVSYEPVHETKAPQQPHEATLLEDKNPPKGAVSKHFKTVLTVLGLAVIATAILFSGQKKRVHTKSDANAQAAKSSAASTDPTNGAKQLQSQVSQDEGQNQRRDELTAAQALAVSQGGQDIHPLYDANGQLIPGTGVQAGAYRGSVPLSAYGKAAPVDELAAQRMEIAKKYQELQFQTRFQGNLVYRAEIVQPGQQQQGQQQNTGGQQYQQQTAPQSASRGGGQTTLTPQQLQAAMAATVSQAHPLGPMQPDQQQALGQNQRVLQRVFGQGESGQESPEAHKRAPEVDIDKSVGKPYVLYEGNFLDTVLVNQLDGDAVGPVITMVTQPVYSHDRQHVLIPEGSKVYGEAKKIGEGGFGQQRRMSLVFHRLIMPDGYSVDLNQFNGIDQIGEMGAKDKVNNHYLQVFGTSVALGVLAGASQVMSGGSSINSNGQQMFTNGAASSMSGSSMGILQKFMQIPPTITIRPGYRIKVFFTQDIMLPSYGNHTINQTF